MRVTFHKKFTKKYYACEKKIRLQFKEQLARFKDDPFDARLNNHRLHGRLKDFYSINATGDFRAVYRVIDAETIEFVLFDTHGNLYE